MEVSRLGQESKTVCLCVPVEQKAIGAAEVVRVVAAAVAAAAAAVVMVAVATVATVTVTDLTRRLGCRMALFGTASTKAVYLTSPWRRLHRNPRSINSRRCRPRRIAKLVRDYDGTAEQEEPLYPLLQSLPTRAHGGKNKQNPRKTKKKKSPQEAGLLPFTTPLFRFRLSSFFLSFFLLLYVSWQ